MPKEADPDGKALFIHCSPEASLLKLVDMDWMVSVSSKGNNPSVCEVERYKSPERSWPWSIVSVLAEPQSSVNPLSSLMYCRFC